jgi:hypothetical protein
MAGVIKKNLPLIAQTARQLARTAATPLDTSASGQSSPHSVPSTPL